MLQTDTTINFQEGEDKEVLARVAHPTNGSDSVDARGTGTDGMKQCNNQLAGNIAHTAMHSSDQRGNRVEE